MKSLVYVFFVFSSAFSFSQSRVLKGFCVDNEQQPIPGVEVLVLETQQKAYTNEKGFFSLSMKEKNTGTVELQFFKIGYAIQSLPIILDASEINLGSWVLRKSEAQEEALPLIDLSSFQDGDLATQAMHFSPFLSSQRSVLENAMAFQFSAAFFSPRGLARKHQRVRINGFLMHSLATGHSKWAMWGGLNDIFNRSQQSHYGLTSQGDYFGAPVADTNINIQPSSFNAGGKISLSTSNQTYGYRSMFSYHRHFKKSGIFLSTLYSKRGGTGYQEGTSYESQSFFLSLEKQWNGRNKTLLTVWHTPLTRGKSAPLTEEVFDLKGKRYNPYWGWDGGKPRNARTQSIRLPVFLVQQQWDFKNALQIHVGFLYSDGHEKQGRLFYNGLQKEGDYFVGGGRNPSPVYYQNLPSYFLRNSNSLDYESAYIAQKQLAQYPQIDWASLRLANADISDGSARYLHYEDVTDQQQAQLAFQLWHQPTTPTRWHTELRYHTTKATYSAQPSDFLGAEKVWNMDAYSPLGSVQNNNSLLPPQAVGLKQPFLYHYGLKMAQFSWQSFYEVRKKNFSFYGGGGYVKHFFQREGYFKNGRFPTASLGKGERFSFDAWRGKSVIRYALNGRHHFALAAGFFQTPPTVRVLYPNVRETHKTTPIQKAENLTSFAFNYDVLLPQHTLQLKLYLQSQSLQNQVSAYYADGVGGTSALFIQEVLLNVKSQQRGIEVGWEYRPLEAISLLSAVAVGSHRFSNSPRLMVFTSPNTTTENSSLSNGEKDFGPAQLSGYALGNGPQNAFSLGFQYNDPNYWRFNITGDYFTSLFVRPNPLRRTASFLFDASGNHPLPQEELGDYGSLISQQQLPNYFLLNAFVSKSWKLKKNYLGVFVSLQNVLDTTYQTGGFEQGRNANYTSAYEDMQREIPLFGSKFWWGRGSTFFSSLYYRF